MPKSNMPSKLVNSLGISVAVFSYTNKCLLMIRTFNYLSHFTKIYIILLPTTH